MKIHRIAKQSLPSAAVFGIALILHGCGGGGGSSSAPSPSPAPSPPLTLASAIDQDIKPFMANYGVTALTITIMRNDTILFEKGYGFQDVAQTIPLPANALMFSASTIKPVTAAAIHKLADDGTLALSDHVFCTGSNVPCWLPQSLLPASYDPRIPDITIAHLLRHAGGWDRSVSGDQASEETEVQAALGITTPPTKDDDIRYMISKPLDFTPGTQAWYSNFGYMLLGRVIEQATGQSYLQYVRTSILAPMGIASSDLEIAASLLKDRNPREPNYITDVTGPSVFSPGTTVLYTDGTVNMQNWASAGTCITTSRALATFAGKYRITADIFGVDDANEGVLLNGKTNSGFHDGAYPGTASLVRQLPSGVSYAVLMNNNDAQSTYTRLIKQSLDSIIEETVH